MALRAARVRRRGVKVGVILLAPLLGYLVIANVIVATGLLEWLVNRNPSKLLMRYRHAYSWWPGKVYVRDFHLTYQAHDIAFELEIDEAVTDVRLTSLLDRRFHCSRVLARGVSYALTDKVPANKLAAPRSLTFPRLHGVVPFRFGPAPDPDKPQPDRTWAVQLDGVDARVRELWVLDFRWRGHGQARGAFEVKTLQSFWVGPATLALEPGTLSVGPAVVSRDFGGEGRAVITPTEVVRLGKLRMLRGLSVDGKFQMRVDDLGFLRAYGLTASGIGALSVDAHVADGAIARGTEVTLVLPWVRAVNEAIGAGFEGTGTLRFSHGEQPWARAEAEASGELYLPLNGERVAIELPRAEGSLSLSTNDFVEAPRLDAFWVTADQLAVPQTEPLKAGMKGHVPFVVPIVLGSGRLTACGVELRGTPRRLYLKVEHARMGVTTVRGEIEVMSRRASGALEAKVKAMRVGIALEEGKASFQLLAKPGWLEQRLEARRARRRPPPW